MALEVKKLTCVLVSIIFVSCSDSTFSGEDGPKRERNSVDAQPAFGPQGGNSPYIQQGVDHQINQTTGENGNIETFKAESGSILSDFGLQCGASKQGMTGRLYRLPKDTKRLPNFSTMTAAGQVDAAYLNVPRRKWSSGFPGVPDLKEWFAIEFLAVLNAPSTGQYSIKTLSDDGSKVYIDDVLVVDNDGVHSPRERAATVHLTAGVHKLKVEWFQGPRNEIALQLFWITPGSGSYSIVPASALSSAKDCNLNSVGSFP